MTYYYVTWDEKKNNHYYEFIHVIPGNNIPHVRSILNAEQSYRRQTGRPHMFHIRITKSRPDEDEIERRERGHLYF